MTEMVVWRSLSFFCRPAGFRRALAAVLTRRLSTAFLRALAAVLTCRLSTAFLRALVAVLTGRLSAEFRRALAAVFVFRFPLPLVPQSLVEVFVSLIRTLPPQTVWRHVKLI
ncbi:MAG: hypothetical protein LBJ64_03350 [Deltaproteobacteria bacterium]|nr:hypothetical protein [Deltaproteobacteria bacterium]